jgi:sugar lactone lactonase YvrE
VQIGTDTTWTAVSTSGTDTCGIDNGKLYCWGLNSEGEDGIGNTTQQDSPVQVGSATNWIAVSRGGAFTCGIRGSGGQGALWCWGGNNGGQLGQGNTTQQTSPVQVGSATNWTAVSTNSSVATGGYGDTCGIQGGALYCWGLNSEGEDGIGNTTQQDSPVQVGSATNWTAVSYGSNSTCGIAGGTLYCWGSNNQGQLGLGNETQYSTPQSVGIYNSVATDLLGQYNSISSTASVNWSGNGFNNGPTPLGLSTAWGCNGGYRNVWGGGIAIDPVNHYLFVSDDCNNRVVVYTLNTDNSIPTSSGGHTASYVLGQSGLQGQRLCQLTQSGLCMPMGLAVDPPNQRLFVADFYNNRVMVFSYASGFTNGENASYVLGQSSFTSYNGNGTWPNSTANNMGSPEGLAYDANDGWLFVSDTAFSRIMVFNVASGTIATGENASYELGQSSFTSYSYPQSTTPARNTVYIPHGVAYDPVNERLFVGDNQFNRIMVFNVAPGTIANNENASYVLGQAGFTSSGCNETQSGMCEVQDVSYDPNSGRLFMTDNNYVRALVFNASPGAIANGENASWVIGAANFTSEGYGLSQGGFTTGNEFSAFVGIHYDPASGRVFLLDPFNNRVLIFEGSYQDPNFMMMLPD